MLSIKNLYARVCHSHEEILKGLDLEIQSGEIHAIMGPNGSGKSTLSKILLGHPQYEITQGSIEYEINMKKKDLIKMPSHERARNGIFLGFQYPVEIQGVNNINFLQTIYNTQCKYLGIETLDIMDFEIFVKKKLLSLKMDPSFLYRSVNVDFSGGEKKRNEIIQMALLNPKLAILDETDSGLDIDSLKIVTEKIKSLKTSQNAFLIITHYPRILTKLKPDYVHIIEQGKIKKTGNLSLAIQIEKHGYEFLDQNV